MFNYFWLLAIAINVINAVILWRRAQPYIQRQPDLRSGYLELIRGFLLGTSLPWVVMGVGVIGGGTSEIADYLYPREGNSFVIAWWVTIWGETLFYSYWILWLGGAEMLIKHPGFFRVQPKNPMILKWGWLLVLLGSCVGSIIIFSLKR